MKNQVSNTPLFQYQASTLKIIVLLSCLLCCLIKTYSQQGKKPIAFAQKYSPPLLRKKDGENKTAIFIVTAKSIPAIVSALVGDKEACKILDTDVASNSIKIQCSFHFLKTIILPLPQVIFADAFIAPSTEVKIIGYDRSFNSINQLDYLLPAANGKNITVAVKENNIEATDIDLLKRVNTSILASAKIENHATTIATIIGGAGNSFYSGRGQANACKFFPSSFSNLFADDAAVLNQNNVSVQNHSYGTIPQQFYGAEAVSYDAASFQNKNILHVFSAGNRGAASATEGLYSGIAGFANITGNFKMAKNIITVAAVNVNGDPATESSSGPLYDGRLAPQLAALGPNGTSDAAAIVSGGIAVLQQVYKDSNAQVLPPASLVKALLYATADDVGKAGINYKTGYGLVNIFTAIKTFQQKNYESGTLNQNQQWLKNITIPANTAQVKIVLSWTDTTATVNNTKALLNDLDLEVRETATGIIYKPWVLNTNSNIDSLSKKALRKRDSLNTAEMVSINLPAAGLYEIKVKGTLIMSANIGFSIAYHADTLNTFVFANPLHTADINISENDILKIKWKTFVTDTNSAGNLSISYNRGASWQIIKTALKIYSNNYLWTVKDTLSTGIFKMETGFGTFLSKEFIIAPITNPQANFVCADSFSFSWNKYPYAGSYNIYSLADSAYLKIIRTVTDTFFLGNSTNNPATVFAVEPVLNNGITAPRSQAFDILQQGVKCFYKTFFYELQNANMASLNIELSAVNYIDKISFEEVTEQGVLLQQLATQTAMAGKFLYEQTTAKLKAGISYFRVKIYLKSGAVVYTDILSLLTSGGDIARFYPNPASKKNAVNIVLEQGFPATSMLQFYDISGRLLRTFKYIPASLDLSSFSNGLLIYKIITPENTLLQTGKILLQ